MHVMSNPETDNIPPPPYTEVADVSDSANQPIRTSLRGGYIRPSLPSEMPSDEINPSSAIMYFEDRDEPELDHSGMSLSSIEYTIKFDDGTTRNDLTFPHPIEAYIARDVNSLDWSTFVNFLFPTHDGVRDEKYGNEKGLQRRSFAEKDTPARRDRIVAVIAEWNAKFFNPRRIQINADFSSLASDLTSRSAATLSTVQDPYVRSLPFQPAQPTMYRDPLAQRSPPQPSRRSLSTSSSSSSSSLSVDSISSKDFEGADLNQVRSALLAFQLDVTKKDHLRASVRQLRDDLRSRRHDLSGNSKELKKEYKTQRKEIKKEVRAIVKEVKATRKAERKIRKAERKSRRKGKRAEYPGNDRTGDFQDKGRRAGERATEQVRRAQERGQEAERQASEKAARVHKIAALAMGQGSMAVARAQGRVADAKARGSKGEGAATQRAQEARTRADTAERRARDTAGRMRYGIDGEQENVF
ncbi:hypothetical protein BDR22DRAFT_863118 [Usnea florida]